MHWQEVVWTAQALDEVEAWGGTGQHLMFFPRLGFWNSMPREIGNRLVAGKAFSP